MNIDRNATSIGKRPRTAYESAKIHVRPWSRFFARFIDLFLFSIIIELFVISFFPALDTIPDALFAMLVIFLWMFVEPLFLATWGTTIGKFLLNIKVRDLNNKKK